MSEDLIEKTDSIATMLRTGAQNILVVLFGLLPLIFIPTIFAPFEHTKMIVIATGVFIALILYSLSVLRSGIVHIHFSVSLILLWLIAGITFVSSLLSGDLKDALIGDLFSIHTTFFVILLALIPTVWTCIGTDKTSVMRMYFLLAGSTIILVVYHILRLIFGAEFLSFGIFTGNASTPVGTWNDLALFLGLTVILSLVALELLVLTKISRFYFICAIFGSLIMLAVINFFMVWFVIGITGLVIIVYSLGKDRFTSGQPSFLSSQNTNTTSLSVSLIVFIVSVLFVVGGATFGGMIARYTGVSYVEVRPSFEATSDIARQVYEENAFLGIGANKFTDAWRLYKDQSINITPFWNTDFSAGNGYITTFFVTTGILGGLAWIAFIGMYFIAGIRQLLGTTNNDRVRYFIGVSSFVSALYIWGMSLVYVPGVVLLLLGALCTGVSLHTFTILSGKPEKIIEMGTNRRTGFILTLGVIVIIITSVSIFYVLGRHYSSVYAFNESINAMQEGKPIAELEQKVLGAHSLSLSDLFARRIAEYQLARLNALVAIKEPTEIQIQEFEDVLGNGISFAKDAVSIDELEPANWSVLAGIYSILIFQKTDEDLQKQLREALTRSRELNPKNPLPYLETAVAEARMSGYEVARDYIDQALALKPNFTEALYLLSQLEIANGNTEKAIQSTRSIIALEPQNAVRYYQLGVLENAQNNIQGAIMAFEKAIVLDAQYANARYLLALAYDFSGRSAEARTQLQYVHELNPENEEVQRLIDIIDTYGSLESFRNQTQGTVSEVTPVTGASGDVQTTQIPETSLVTPVNTFPRDAEIEETSTSQ